MARPRPRHNDGAIDPTRAPGRDWTWRADTAFVVASSVTIGSLARSLSAIGSPVGKTGARFVRTDDKSSPVHLRPSNVHNARRDAPCHLASRNVMRTSCEAEYLAFFRKLSYLRE